MPVFQRPYTWNKKEQWEPFWSDVLRVCQKVLQAEESPVRSHFLGAIVLQQLPNKSGDLELRTVIDGQQRLTTLQILIDSVHAEFLRNNLNLHAAKLVGLIENDEVFRKVEEDQFKLWPTNLDRPAFKEIMSAKSPINYKEIPEKYQASKFFQAHRFFAQETQEWLTSENNEIDEKKADALVKTLRELIHIVVIDLDTSDDAQEIFETLNARGAKLEASDLIKNFVFQKLFEEGGSELCEKVYTEHWLKFETSFWVAETSIGREKFQMSSLFFFHWVVFKTASDLVEREVFSKFKEYVISCNLPMSVLVKELSKTAEIYESKIIKAGDDKEGNLDKHSLLIYRARIMETSVIRPLLIEIFDPAQSQIPTGELAKFFEVLESWLVRRMLVKATTKGYNKVFVDVLSKIKENREQAGSVIENYFVGQQNYTTYWPDDLEITKSLSTLSFYGRISNGRQRIILEAIEDHLRGWIGESISAAGTRVKRSTFQIEHIMPQSWQSNWPLEASFTEQERNEVVQRLGNLTLLTEKLNKDVSNRAWKSKPGKPGKYEKVEESDLLQLNKKLLAIAKDEWTDSKINERTLQLIEVIQAIWRVPTGHTVTFNSPVQAQIVNVEIIDLLEYGSLQPGQILYANQKEFESIQAQILPDGRITIEKEIFDSVSGAGSYVRKKSTNGWSFWLVAKTPKKSLKEVRKEYKEALSIDTEYDADESEGIDE